MSLTLDISSFRVKEQQFSFQSFSTSTRFDAYPRRALKSAYRACSATIAEQQELLYAEKRRALWIMLHGLDCAGKDSAIRHIFRGVNPIGLGVVSFTRPNEEELRQHFLQRHRDCLPPSGHIAIHNRSHYEEVTTVRVHSELLDLRTGETARPSTDRDFWESRIQQIVDFESMVSKRGVEIVKIFLHLSPGVQLSRLYKRVTTPAKQWKFESADFEERKFAPQLMEAYECAIASTNKPWAPWFIVPADDKEATRWIIGSIVVQSLLNLKLSTPRVTGDALAQLEGYRSQILAELNRAKA